MAKYSIILTHTTVMALSLIFSANSLDINVKPEFVSPNDKNVIITCAGQNDPTKVLQKVLKMGLLKLNRGGQWIEVVENKVNGSTFLTDPNAKAVGHLKDVANSNLIVTWQVAPHDIHGRYRCEARVTTNSGVVTLKSRVLDVKSLSSHLSLFLEDLRKSEKRLVTKVNEALHRAMESSKTNLLSDLESKFGNLKEYLDNKTAVTDDNRRPEDKVETVQWPAGIFALVMPSDGCPLHPPAWIKSFKKNKIPYGDKYYPLDDPSHVANPHKKNGFIYRQFCTLPALPERTSPWPAGSYCLYRLETNPTCPTGFEVSEAHVKVMQDANNVYLFYFTDERRSAGTSFTNSAFSFCCRHDGNATTPIELPVSHPFYLVRHGGRCQEVKGMHVMQDVFIMETVANYDRWVDYSPDFRPDVSLKPYKEEMCYYSRRQD